MTFITCRICGEALTRNGTPPVSCRACDTSYHIDCWAYNGSRCGVYGCRSERAVAGLPAGVRGPDVSACTAAPGRYVWRRPASEFACLAGVLVLVPVLPVWALMAPASYGLLVLGLAWLSWLVLTPHNLLRAMEFDEQGVRCRYLLQPALSFAWADVVRGPGIGDWSGALLLRDGTVVTLPAGEPGSDELLRRTAVALGSRGVLFIGEGR